MNHVWIIDPNPMFSDEKDYICDICAMKSFYSEENKKFIIYLSDKNENVDKLNCEEYIIKNIIE